MNYWWVNQNQTYAQETEGGYMWSPKVKADGSRNTFYDNMRKVVPGDIVFSFYGTKIPCLGIITSHGYGQIKPEFGTSGATWDTDGWMVNVNYKTVNKVIAPKDHMEVIRPLLPSKYSPLQQNGRGNQGVYLTEIPQPLALKLLELIGDEVFSILEDAGGLSGAIMSDKEAEANRVELLVRKDKSIKDTETEAIVKARKGQGQFRDDVITLHKKCLFSGIENPQLLKASHIKPWAKCNSHKERLDPLNGLSLTPAADHLFDRGYISFDDKGRAIFTESIKVKEFQSLGIDPVNNQYRLPLIDPKQLEYIEYHRNHIFKA